MAFLATTTKLAGKGSPIVVLKQSVRIVELKAHAKINLYLDILHRRDDGYHELQTVMQSIDLCDELRLFSQPSAIEVCCNHPTLANPRDNLVFKVARILRDKTGSHRGARIELAKNIPIGAGLAGGSADAAAAMMGLNILWGLNLSQVELQEFGSEIGSDVPFCLEGGTMLAEGRGERLRRVNEFPKATIVIAMPDFSLSTAKVYHRWDREKRKSHPDLTDLTKLLRALEVHDLRVVGSNLANALEEVVFSDYPEVEAIKKRSREAGAIGTLMSGSGPSVFSIVETREKALGISHALKGLCSTIITAPCNRGIEII